MYIFTSVSNAEEGPRPPLRPPSPKKPPVFAAIRTIEFPSPPTEATVPWPIRADRMKIDPEVPPPRRLAPTGPRMLFQERPSGSFHAVAVRTVLRTLRSLPVVNQGTRVSHAEYGNGTIKDILRLRRLTYRVLFNEDSQKPIERIIDAQLLTMCG
jgi:hypothetical protein